MSLRTAENPDAMLEAVSVQTAASLLDCSDGTVRALIKAGEIQGFRLGARVLRIYKHTIEEYQIKNKIITHQAQKNEVLLRITGTARQREAKAFLKNLGCI